MPSQALGFAEVLAGGVLMAAGISDQSLREVLSGHGSPLAPLLPDDATAAAPGAATGAGSVKGQGGTPAANQALGKALMLAHGWGPDQWPALQELWTRESGWDAEAVNSSSGAAGIPQALGHGHVFDLGDARAQILWGLNYIDERYGSPQAALAFHNSHNWY